MSRREFMMLGKEWSPDRTLIGGWLMSEKLDGMRCLWDGGVSRGVDARDVPWANVARGDPLEKATGLWSRYGKIIRAPSEWTSGFPNHPLDLELWSGRGEFQHVVSVCKRHDASMSEWKNVKGMVLDAPTWAQLMVSGNVKAPSAHWDAELGPQMVEWVRHRGGVDGTSILNGLRVKAPQLEMVEQEKLPWGESEARAAVEDRLQDVLSKGGEGLILRHPSKPWHPKRVDHVVKVKPARDAEGVVVGFTWGRETEKGSRHLGRMGALVLDYEGKRLELSGFTDEERAVDGTGLLTGLGTEMDIPVESVERQGKDASDEWEVEAFPRGTKVTFKYRELTWDGIPKEARYWRRRDE